MPKLAPSRPLPIAAVALLFCSLAAPASAVSIDWVAVGDPGNAADSAVNCIAANCGSVPYAYRISKYEITNAQYVEFLNAKAASDPLGLYNPTMTSSSHGGITRSGSDGSYGYSVKLGMADTPVNYVSFYDSVRFANWLHNGQGSGDTETGAYTLLGGTATPSNGTTVARNPGATIFLTSENEWFKAAFYDAVSTSYFDYPAGSNAEIACSAPTATPNSANCASAVGTVVDVGSYPGSASPYGTVDQGGNVREWSDDLLGGSDRVSRGGSLGLHVWRTAAFFVSTNDATFESESDGFRLASPIPEPGTGLLVAAGTLGLASWRRRAPPPRAIRRRSVAVRPAPLPARRPRSRR
jgi:formylglycine-generating enzyme required for sulfatase activity